MTQLLKLIKIYKLNVYVFHYFLSFYRSFISINICIYNFFLMRNDITSEKNKKELFSFFVYTHIAIILLIYKHEIQRKDAETASHILTFPGEPEERRLSCIHLRWET